MPVQADHLQRPSVRAGNLVVLSQLHQFHRIVGEKSLIFIWSHLCGLSTFFSDILHLSDVVSGLSPQKTRPKSTRAEPSLHLVSIVPPRVAAITPPDSPARPFSKEPKAPSSSQASRILLPRLSTSLTFLSTFETNLLSTLRRHPPRGRRLSLQHRSSIYTSAHQHLDVARISRADIVAAVIGQPWRHWEPIRINSALFICGIAKPT